jgi:serine/threonine protein kinase
MTAEMGQLIGQVIDGKYRIVRLLGTGGMGAVYEGENLRIRRKVAIKMLHVSVSTQADVVKRFEREAQAAALVGSEHICEVLDLGMLPDGTRYMVMEYLDGETLTGRIKKNGRLVPAQSIPIMLQVLDALGAAHAAGIIHRDLKPDNIFILPQKGGMRDFIKILDFGVSKFSQTGGEEMNVTRAGAVVGTPYYMSPEQARGNAAVDGRTDIYAMGVLLFQATTGQVPYQAETFNELLFKIVLEVAPPPQTYVPDLDPDFAAIIQRAMAREPTQRYQSCAEFRDALLAFQAARAAGYPAPLPDRSTGAGMRAPATQVLDMSQLPQAANAGPWQARTGVDPTLPLEPSPLAGMRQSNAPFAPPGAPATPSGAAWGNASGAGQNTAQPMATSNAWGNASGSGVAPRSKAPLVAGIVALMTVLGGGLGVGAYLIFGRATPPEAAAGVPEIAPSASAVAPLPSAVPALSAPPTTTASAPPPDDSGAAASTSPSATANAKPAPTTKPTSTSKPAPTPTTKPTTKPPIKPGKTGSDLGY